MKAGGILFFVGLGFLLILIGLEGNLGSVLGAIIDPSNMRDSGGTTNTTPGTDFGPTTGG